MSTNYNKVDIAIIGAGMAGMAAAIYARKAGYSVRIFEKHFLPGGMCTAWKRKGYTFDYCIDFFYGISKKHDMYEMWNELGILPATRFQAITSFGKYVGADGTEFNLYTNYKKLEEEMMRVAPEDEKMIKSFCRAIKKMRHFYMSKPPQGIKDIPKLLKALPKLPALMKWTNISTYEWCSKLQNPLLKEALPALIGWTDFPLGGPMSAFAMMDTMDTAYPIGGSLPIAKLTEKRVLKTGAEIEYKSPVKRILTEGGKASGIELENGSIQEADYVISACDAKFSFEKLLNKQIAHPLFEEMFETADLVPSMLQISLGIKKNKDWQLDNLPAKIQLPLSKPITIDGKQVSRLRLYNYASDPEMAPENGTSLIVKFAGDFEYWNNLLQADKDVYKSEKQRVLTVVRTALEEHFPGIGNAIEAHDVATPTSCVRYTNSWRGSSQGWHLTLEMAKRFYSGESFPSTFPELQNFHLIGQWITTGGGIPMAARTGQDAIAAIAGKRRKSISK